MLPFEVWVHILSFDNTRVPNPEMVWRKKKNEQLVWVGSALLRVNAVTREASKLAIFDQNEFLKQRLMKSKWPMPTWVLQNQRYFSTIESMKPTERASMCRMAVVRKSEGEWAAIGQYMNLQSWIVYACELSEGNLELVVRNAKQHRHITSTFGRVLAMLFLQDKKSKCDLLMELVPKRCRTLVRTIINKPQNCFLVTTKKVFECDYDFLIEFVTTLDCNKAVLAIYHMAVNRPKWKSSCVESVHRQQGREVH